MFHYLYELKIRWGIYFLYIMMNIYYSISFFDLIFMLPRHSILHIFTETEVFMKKFDKIAYVSNIFNVCKQALKSHDFLASAGIPRPYSFWIIVSFTIGNCLWTLCLECIQSEHTIITGKNPADSMLIKFDIKFHKKLYVFQMFAGR